MKIIFNKIVDWLDVLFHPDCWAVLDKFNKPWDLRLNELMKMHKFEIIDDYTATIGGATVWIKNHPYSSFDLINTSDGRYEFTRLRPSRATILKAGRKLKKDTTDPIEQIIDEL